MYLFYLEEEMEFNMLQNVLAPRLSYSMVLILVTECREQGVLVSTDFYC